MTYKCLIADDERPARELLVSYVEQVPRLEVSAVCQNGLEVIEALRGASPDILFLDIQMPQLKGTEVVRLIKDRLPVVVFTTAYEQYALDAFDLDVADYLLKPFGFDRFVQAADKAMDRVRSIVERPAERPVPFIMVKSEYKLVRIALAEILYIEALREYVRIFTPERSVLTLDTMKNMETVLPADRFCRIHKSYIAALEKIDSLQGNMAEVGGEKLPIGRSYKKQLLERLHAPSEDGK